MFRLIRENMAYEARFRPRASLCHQQGEIPNYLREARMGKTVVERRHLIGVVNLSAARINSLRVVAESFEPYLQGATWVDAALHPLRAAPDNDGRFDVSVGDGNPGRYVEVFQELNIDGQNAPLLSLVYDSTGLIGLRRYIIGEWFAVTLRLEGDIKPVRAKFVAKRNYSTNKFDVFVAQDTVHVGMRPEDYRVVELKPSSSEIAAAEARPSHAAMDDDWD